MEKIKNNIEISIAQRTENLDEINARINRWKDYKNSLREKTWLTLNTEAINAELAKFSEQCCDENVSSYMSTKESLKEAVTKTEAELVKAKNNERLQAIAVVQLENDSKLFSKWLQNAGKKIDRYLAIVEEEKIKLSKFQATLIV